MKKSVKIGPIRYKVKMDKHMRSDDDAHRLWGKTRHGPCCITISSEIDVQQMYETLWHELVHTILNQAGMRDDYEREDLIDALAHGIMGVLRENKWVTDFKGLGL